MAADTPVNAQVGRPLSLGLWLVLPGHVAPAVRDWVASAPRISSRLG
jgi:hypothetical protein